MSAVSISRSTLFDFTIVKCSVKTYGTMEPEITDTAAVKSLAKEEFMINYSITLNALELDTGTYFLGCEYPLPRSTDKIIWTDFKTVKVCNEVGSEIAEVAEVYFQNNVGQDIENYDFYLNRGRVTHSPDGLFYIRAECSFNAMPNGGGEVDYAIATITKGIFYLVPPWWAEEETYEIDPKSEEFNYDEYLRSPVWKTTRRHVMERDGYQCICGNNATLVHHKTYKNIGREKLSELVSLCHRCHDHVHKHLFNKTTPN